MKAGAPAALLGQELASGPPPGTAASLGETKQGFSVSGEVSMTPLRGKHPHPSRMVNIGAVSDAASARGQEGVRSPWRCFSEGRKETLPRVGGEQK